MKLTIKSQIANQIEKFYLELLKRHPTPADLQGYLSLLESGKIHLKEIPVLMKNSDEYKILKYMKEMGKGPITTKDGIIMYLNPSDKGVSYYLSKDKVWEPYETELIKKFCGKSTNVVDIGAHIGYYSLLCASIAKNGRILSFEPEKDNFEILKENVVANKFMNIKVSESAISDKNGELDLYLSNEGNTGDNRLFDNDFREIIEKRRHVKVKSYTLDEFLIHDGMKPDMIKMDIQGAEILALKGMQKTLQNSDKLIILTEFWPRAILAIKKSPIDFLQLLNSSGFDIYEINHLQQKLMKKSNEQLVEENLDNSNAELQTDLLCLKNISLKN